MGKTAAQSRSQCLMRGLTIKEATPSVCAATIILKCCLTMLSAVKFMQRWLETDECAALVELGEGKTEVRREN